jgi:hypothetical protein
MGFITGQGSMDKKKSLAPVGNRIPVVQPVIPTELSRFVNFSNFTKRMVTCGPSLGNELASTLPREIVSWKRTDYETRFPWIRKLMVLNT